MKCIGYSGLKESQDSNEQFSLIHILPKNHFDNYYIKGSINICVYEVSFIENISNLKLSLDDKIVVYGDSINDLDAIAACEKLEMNFYTNVFYLKGGISSADKLEGNKNILSNEQFTKLKDKNYMLNKGSSLQWTGKNINGKHFGTVDIDSGTVNVKNNILSGSFIVNMNAIKTLDLKKEEGSDQLDLHLKSEDFFLTSIFPKASFRFENVKPKEKSFVTDINYLVNGNMEIKGIHKKITIPMNISQEANTLILTTNFDFDKTQWNIFYGSSKFFKYLGMHKIFDNISIEMRLELS